MIEIKSSESGTYDFGLEISGDANGQPTLRMVIVHPAGYLLSFLASKLDVGGYRVFIPCLETLLPSGEHPFVLEVVIGDRIFHPMSDTLKVIEPPRINVIMNKVATPTQPTVSAAFVTQSQQNIAVTIPTLPTTQYESSDNITESKKKPAQVDIDLMATLLKKRKN